ncbi:hypothetical protein KIH24_13325 [Rhizobiales bacterium TNE-4]|nr:hypothetical protein [Rhizobiales bacterium TNE-4]MBV1828599.1 hypothetical protein [Rhizobiales bacterium TNE-4]
MKHASQKCLQIIGCGSVFKSIQVDIGRYCLDYGQINFVEFDDVSSIALNTASVLSDLSPEAADLFLAVDQNALNYARLELYGPAKLKGFKCTSMVHDSAALGVGTYIGENVWIGPNVRIFNRCNIAADTFIAACSTIGDDTHVGAHSWIGKNCLISDSVSIGTNCVICDLININAKIKIGRNTILAQPGLILNNVQSGTFHEFIYEKPGHMIGRNYSFSKRGVSK